MLRGRLFWIDGSPYCICVPNLDASEPESWESRVSALEENFDRAYQTTTWCWAADDDENIPEYYGSIFLKAPGAHLRSGFLPKHCCGDEDVSTVGFLPDILPLAQESPEGRYTLCEEMLSDIPDGRIVSLGTLSIGGDPVAFHPEGVLTEELPEYTGRAITFGDTHPDERYQIRLMKCGRRFFPVNALLRGVTYMDLYRQGFTHSALW